ncbi:hypothetical protein [Dictyobacter formicarum]|uniref:HAMP domain-containing protein n=1 Tax=Dictyobacter formicarum TaxID=2778368 RepID=A0ABQ3VF28_9CHLR|nr:hypothetical protein [Dictyobacter formicarum]GHO84770.1 hypothetical protein KSZ_27760 [Dictyobacter formicarum]
MMSPNYSFTEPAYIQAGEEKPRGFNKLLAPWYRYTAPPAVSSGASFEQRELVRRGRLASTILLVLCFILIFLVGPIGFLGPNHQILFVALGILVLIVVCAPLNRKGYVNAVGLIISLSVNLGIFSSILRSPGGLAPDTIAIFDMLVFSEVFVVSLLPVNWVIPDALMNIIFSYVVLTYWPRTPLLAEAMKGGGYFIIVSRPIQIHLIVTVVLYLWVVSATRAIQRADRAEEIAKLQHDIAAQEHIIADEKRALDASIQEIMMVHSAASNGSLSARVSLQEGAPLWPVAVSLNNLLSRLQRLQHNEEELQKLAPRLRQATQIDHEYKHLQAAVMQLADAIHESNVGLKPVQVTNNGTAADAIVMELLGKYVLSLPPRLREPIVSTIQRERMQAPWE